MNYLSTRTIQNQDGAHNNLCLFAHGRIEIVLTERGDAMIFLPGQEFSLGVTHFECDTWS